MHRRSQALPVALALLVVLAPGVGSAPRAVASTVSAGQSSEEGDKGVKVTLITGDTITWHSTPGQPVVDVDAAPRENGQGVQFFSQGTPDAFYVYPSDVADRIQTGVLDRELFNIPAMVKAGLTGNADLPVIVTFDNPPGTRSETKESRRSELARHADALPATEHPVPVLSLQGTGVKVDHQRTRSFFKSLDESRGIKSVLLDRPVKAMLDKSVPQIGAPEVWRSGYTGSGVKVAVLDTGIDSTHPDLVGKVTQDKNFSTSNTTLDRFGHGTHVASTIVGSGAASDGEYRGVAPDAQLLNGKVLDDKGNGYESSVIAGMEWAGAEGSDVVSMSLGDCCWSDGTDPMAQAVNRLSAQYDTLFVIAAGNSGSNGLGTPGTADAALTVGAVDKSDKLAPFSSRGPRLGDFAAKPTITAPGVDIVAARAAGTSMGTPVNDLYTSSSGTSMATPHVAGAAALLKQARPDLSAPQLKDALASTAVDGGYTWREQGAGRVDVARAVSQRVHASAALDFGNVANTTQPVERQVTYTNATDDPVTLNLVTEADSGAPPSLSVPTVTVPAHGDATATVTVDPADYRQGSYGGAIAAEGSGVRLRTAFGFGRVNTRTLTVNVLDSQGAPADALVTAVHNDYDRQNPIGNPAYSARTENGVATLVVPEGIYTPAVVLSETASDGSRRSSVLVKTEADVRSDATVTLDARETVLLDKPATPRPADARAHSGSVDIDYPVTLASYPEPVPVRYTVSWMDHFKTGKASPVYVSPADPGKLTKVRLVDYWILAEPKPLMPMQSYPDVYSDTPAYSYHLPYVYPNGIPAELRRNVTGKDLVAVPNSYHAEVPDSIVAISEAVVPRPGFFFPYLAFKPGDVTQYYLADDRFWLNRLASLTAPQADGSSRGLSFVSGDLFRRSEAGSRRAKERWFEAPLTVGTVDVRHDFLDYYTGEDGFFTERSATLARGGADGDEFVPATEMLGNSPGQSTGLVYGGIGPSNGSSFGSWRMWNVDAGTELAADYKYRANQPVFRLSPESARYRLEQTESWPDSYKGILRTKSAAQTVWTFRSHRSMTTVPAGYSCNSLGGGNPRHGPNANLTCQFQPMIQLRYELGLDQQNQAEAGRAQSLTIVAGSHSGAVDRAPVTKLAVEYSTDGGLHWRKGLSVGKARTVDGYQRFKVCLQLPPLDRTSKSVWLRVKAKDASGGTVTQTVTDAYFLK
ncbi:S8 family peptidase [Streptomyces sp. NPDC002143]